MSQLAKVVAIRHCQNLGGDDLTTTGLTNANNLAQKIKFAVDGHSKIIVLTSPSGRAKVTATTIAQVVGAEVVVVDDLELDYYHYGARQILAVQNFFADHEVVVMVTHYEAPSGIMNRLSKERFNQKFPSEECIKGTGFMFDCGTGDITILSGLTAE